MPDRPDWNFPTEKPSAPESFPAEPARSTVQRDERGRAIRPDWGPGGEVRNVPVPAPPDLPTPQQVIAEIKSGATGPSEATQQLAEPETPASPDTPAPVSAE